MNDRRDTGTSSPMVQSAPIPTPSVPASSRMRQTSLRTSSSLPVYSSVFGRLSKPASTGLPPSSFLPSATDTFSEYTAQLKACTG